MSDIAALRVYLAGPMRGLLEFNFPAFHAGAKQLRDMGFVVVSPAEHDLELGLDPTLPLPDWFSIEESMRWDLHQVLDAHVVIVLPGWETSSGCAVELAVAKAIGIPILQYPTLQPIEEAS